MINSLIVVSCLLAASHAQYPGYQGFGPAPGAAPAPTGQDGQVVDTPEVAQAKAAHFAEFARAAARATEDKAQEYPGAPEQYSRPSQYSYGPAQPGPIARANYAPAPAPVHQYQPQPAPPAYYQQSHFAPEPKSFGIPAGAKAPFQPAPLAEDGTVVDTPEVAALKSARLQELAAAEARAAKYGNDEYSADAQGQYQGPPQQVQYQAPGSIPRAAYPGPPGPYPGTPQASYPSARAYQPQAPIYQPQPQPAYQHQQPQSYQAQY